MTIKPTLAPTLPSLYTGSLPDTVRTRGGAVFDPHSDVWDLREGTVRFKAKFDKLPATEAFKASFKAVLVWYAQNESLAHWRNAHYHVSCIIAFKFSKSTTLVSELTSVDVLNYKAHLGKAKEWYVGVLSGILRKWSNLGMFGVARDAIVLLDQLKLTGNAKGTAVLTMDPIKGPFTAIELEAIQNSLNEAYASQEIADGPYTLCWLFMALGQRAIQYAGLKICDFYSVVDRDGHESFVLRIPRAKQRNSQSRSAFKERVLGPDLGRLVAKHVAAIREQFANVLPDPDNAPMFPVELDENTPTGFEYHPTSVQIRNILNSTLNRLNVISERTGEKIYITSKRFRMTIGTRAAEEGHGEFIIAELLDHTDTQNVGVYVQSTPAIIERIDKAVAMQMAPLAQAFSGKIIKDASEASLKDDPLSVIRAPSITGTFEGMSSCGKHGFCGFMKPIACYPCPSFEPWLDGPHEQVLEFLLADRERKLNSSGHRLASINDRTILAVAEVVQRCEIARAQKQENL